jgi:phage gpG-like protein
MVGFGQPDAAYHEFGTEKMHRRGLLFADPEKGELAPDDEKAILDAVLDHLQKAI